MKKKIVGVIVLISIFLIGTFSTQYFIKPYFFPTWQGDNDSSCDQEIRNPLCNYSVYLREIPNVSLLELSKNPQKYNDKIIRVQGRYYSELEDYFDSRLYSISNNEIGHQTLDSIGVWNDKVNQTLCHFIDINASETSQADVTLIVEFHYETSNTNGRLERNHNNPL